MKLKKLILSQVLILQSQIENITRRLESMATKEDVMAMGGQLEGVIAQESTEVRVVIDQKVHEAVAPLLVQISDLSGKLAGGASPSGVVFSQEEVDALYAQLQAALNSIGAMVTPQTAPAEPAPAPAPVTEKPTSEPTPAPVEPAPEQPVSEPATTQPA